MKINQLVTESQMTCPKCGGPAFSDLILAEKKDACYQKVKASAKVWPSAYASGRLVQCRKKGAANYGNKSEGVAEDEEVYLGGMSRAERESRFRRRKQDLLQDYALLGKLTTDMIRAINNEVFLTKEQIIDFYKQQIEDPDLTALEYAHENNIPSSGLLKGVLRYLVQRGFSMLDIRKLMGKAAEQKKKDTLALPPPGPGEGVAEATGDEKFDKAMRRTTGDITPDDAAEMWPTQEFEPINLDSSYLPMMEKYKAKLFPLAYEYWTDGDNADELRALGWEPDYGDDYVMVVLSGIGHDGHIQYDKYDFDAEGENVTEAADNTAFRQGYERGIRYYRRGPQNPYKPGTLEFTDYNDGYQMGEADSYDKYDTSSMD
jgi:hypothetical protein